MCVDRDRIFRWQTDIQKILYVQIHKFICDKRLAQPQVAIVVRIILKEKENKNDDKINYKNLTLQLTHALFYRLYAIQNSVPMTSQKCLSKCMIS